MFSKGFQDLGVKRGVRDHFSAKTLPQPSKQLFLVVNSGTDGVRGGTGREGGGGDHLPDGGEDHLLINIALVTKP